MNTKELIDEANSLPIEERMIILDSLLRSMNLVDVNVHKEWVERAKKRIKEIRTGKVTCIPVDQVFEKIEKRFKQ